MADDEKLSPVKKIIAMMFAVALIAIACLMVVRIIQKPAYEAREKAKCEIMAASALELFAFGAEGKNAADFFGEASEIVTDHKAMPGNLIVKFFLREEGGRTFVRAFASTGWNSRSPSDASFEAEISEGRLLPADGAIPKELSDALKKTSPHKKDKTFTFTDSYGKIPPLRIDAELALCEYGGESYTVLKPISNPQ